MKSTTHFTEITNQKTEKFLSERGKLVACSPARLPRFVSTKIYSTCVLPFLTNEAARFISHGIGRFYFSGNLLLTFLLWYDLKILVKSREGGTFLCLASSVNVKQKEFF